MQIVGSTSTCEKKLNSVIVNLCSKSCQQEFIFRRYKIMIIKFIFGLVIGINSNLAQYSKNGKNSAQG